MKQDIFTARKIAEQHLDEMMNNINPLIGFTFDANHTAYLFDIPGRRMILDREPDESEKAALLAYSVELQLRTQGDMEFEWDGALYIHEKENGYWRYTLDRKAMKWNAEQRPLTDFILISNYVEQHTISEKDRAARAAEDMRRVSEGMGKKPTGKVEE